MKTRLRNHSFRPSAALVVAVAALVVALGLPADAARLLTGKDVKDHSLTAKELSRKTVTKLRSTPAGSVDARALADGSVTAGELADGSVSSSELLDGSVTGADIADGSLDSRETTRFSGRFRLFPPTTVSAHRCWSGEPVGLAPEIAGADISGDLVLATPGAGWPGGLTFTVHGSAATGRFVIAACNPTDTDVTTPADGVPVRFAVIDLP